MKPTADLKLVSQLLDLPLLDTNGEFCGIVDDVEFSGRAGRQLKLKALLVGPGAYDGRMPGWAMTIVRAIAGDRVTRVPVDRIATIKSVVKLNCTAGELGLHKSENKARAWIPRKGAL
jgi:sporulation protein YlmC with PRC-barrel domain